MDTRHLQNMSLHVHDLPMPPCGGQEPLMLPFTMSMRVDKTF